jgi:hypothetical protein
MVQLDLVFQPGGYLVGQPLQESDRQSLAGCHQSSENVVF